jgi:HSP20 family protein
MNKTDKKRTMLQKATLLLAAPILAVNLNASSLFFDQGFENDFKEFNRLAQAMIRNHIKDNSLANMGYPQLNMQEDSDKYVLRFELPGMDKSEVKLSLEEDKMLTIEGEKRRESRENNSTFIKEEISYGKFKRVIRLPNDTDSDKMTTKYKDGVLTVTIPKKEIKKSTTKIIPIN